VWWGEGRGGPRGGYSDLHSYFYVVSYFIFLPHTVSNFPGSSRSRSVILGNSHVPFPYLGSSPPTAVSSLSVYPQFIARKHLPLHTRHTPAPAVPSCSPPNVVQLSSEQISRGEKCPRHHLLLPTLISDGFISSNSRELIEPDGNFKNAYPGQKPTFCERSMMSNYTTGNHQC